MAWALDLLGIRSALEDCAKQLHRLADVAEKQAKFVAPGSGGKPEESVAFYTSDAERARLEAARMAYELRTGEHLADWEDVPTPTDSSGREWQ